MFLLRSINQEDVIPLSKKDPVQDIFPLLSNRSEVIICVRQGETLGGYKFLTTNETWVNIWEETVFTKKYSYTINKYPWLLSTKLLINKDVIILHRPEGIQFYSANSSGLELLKNDGHFHDVYNFKTIWGDFYPTSDWIGLMTISQNGHINFYAATPDSFLPEETYPFFPLETDLQFSASWKTPNTDFFVTDLRQKSSAPSTICLRTYKRLEFWKFNDDYLLELVLNTTKIIRPSNGKDFLYFGNITNQIYQDIIHLNDSGLYVYQYQKEDYMFLNYNNSLPSLYNYNEYLKIIDIDGDGQQELVVTDARGLTTYKFDTINLEWKVIIDPDNLEEEIRFGKVIRVLPPIFPMIPHVSIFIQDQNGRLILAKVHKGSVTTTPLSIPKDDFYFETPENYYLIPEQIPRTSSSVKTSLKSSSYWKENPLKHAVDMNSGQINFRLPLVDLSEITGWAIRLNLNYDSKEAETSDILGAGWSLPIFQNFITVDHKGSIFLEDAQYFLVAQGHPQYLNVIQDDDKIKKFSLAEKTDQKIDIQYNKYKEVWTIENSDERVTYGTAAGSLVQDSLQFSLQWPNWRGVGTNKEQMVSVVTSWYLNSRVNKHNNKTLNYYYEFDTKTLSKNKSYTSAVRLKTITDQKDLKISFEYSRKLEEEFSPNSPLDDEGNVSFPIKLEDNSFIEGWKISTAFHYQKVKFFYEVVGNIRLLRKIEEESSSFGYETLANFDYSQVLNLKILKSCTLSNGVTADFDYDILKPTTPMYSIDNILRYKFKGNVQISYGKDYAIVAYVDTVGNNLVLFWRITNRQLTRIISKETLYSWTVNNTNEASILKFFNVMASESYFLAFIDLNNRKVLYIFNRDKENWAKNPSKTFSFDKGALVDFNKKIIAVVESNNGAKLKLYNWENKQRNWESRNLVVSSKSFTRIRVCNNFVVGYNDNELWLFYHLEQHGWRWKILQSNVKYSDQANSLMNNFDLNKETSSNILKLLNQNGLQISQNIILLNLVSLWNYTMYAHLHLFIINDKYELVQNKTLDISGDKIYNLSIKTVQDGTTYTSGYVYERGKFYLRVKSITGKVSDDLYKEIPDKSKHRAILEKIIRHINNDKDFIVNRRSHSLVNWQEYLTRLSENRINLGSKRLFRFTGTDWQEKRLSEAKEILLGKHFKIETNGLSYKIKQGKIVREFSVNSTFLNRYPLYLSFHSSPTTIQVQLFKNESTLGEAYTFYSEQLLPQSEFDNIITFTNGTLGTKELLVRPLSVLTTTKEVAYIKQITLTDEDYKRVTGYQRAFRNDPKNLTYSEIVTVIPGGRKSISGWIEYTNSMHMSSENITSSAKYFDAKGKEVLAPPRKEPQEFSNKTVKTNKSILYDKTEKFIISDFSPFELEDDMVGYFGFELYEDDQIGTGNWLFDENQVIKKRFAFTGENYLELKTSPFKRVFEPRIQEITYLASCWIRSKNPPLLNNPVPYFKALVTTTNGEKIIGLLGKSAKHSGDWYYVEILINFQQIKEIHRKLINYNRDPYDLDSMVALALPHDVRYKITIQVKPKSEEVVDVDDVQFFPLVHEFEAMVYNSQSKKQTATIYSNGLVTTYFYNHLQQDIAIVENDELSTFLSRDQLKSKITIEPQRGFYETFDEFSMGHRWKIDNSNAWKTAPGQLWHNGPDKDIISASSDMFDKESSAVRFYFALENLKASITLCWGGILNVELKRVNTLMNLEVNDNILFPNLPLAGELIVMLEKSCLWLWLDGHLLVDQQVELPQKLVNVWESFSFKVQGTALIEDCFVMSRPALEVEFYNSFGEKTQHIKLVDYQSVRVTETLYDELGRDAIRTKTTGIKREPGKFLISYRPNFVTNAKSVWHLGKMEGEVSHMNPEDKGFPYFRTEYARNPLNEEITIGLAGAEFSISGNYAVKFSTSSNISFLNNLFPTKEGYRQQVQYLTNGSLKVFVFDKFNNQVAKYVRVPSFNHHLSTFEYDQERRLVKILPPMYHEKLNTFGRLNPWKFGEKFLTEQEKFWQEVFCTRYVYDNLGRLVYKKTSDSGVTEFLYNELGLLKFIVSVSNKNQPENIIIYDYDQLNQLIRTGTVKQPLPTSDWKSYLKHQSLDTQVYQQFYYNDESFDPTVRGQIKHCITYNEGEPVLEKLMYNNLEKIIHKSSIIEQGESDSDQFNDFKKEYLMDKLQILQYPLQIDGNPFRLVHSYDRLGQLLALGTPDNPEEFAKFTYRPTGELEREIYQPHSRYSYNRTYTYNSPGFLEKISDPFLTEGITYTNNGYGQNGYGDGMVMQASFNATWPEKSDNRWFQLKDADIKGNFSSLCFTALKNLGYISENDRPLKLFIPELEQSLPLVCDRGSLEKNISHKLAPKYYGHKYSYGNHQELVKAKYFTDDSIRFTKPLQPTTFALEIKELTIEQSEHIWQLLNDSGYIITDQQRNNPSSATGKRGASIFRRKDLSNDLKKLNDGYVIYTEQIERIVLKAIVERKILTQDDFCTVFLKWEGLTHSSPLYLQNQKIEKAKIIWKMLVEKNYISKALHKNFENLLRPYSKFIPALVKVIQQYFAYGLGESSFDLEAFEIDANGNHRLFYKGQDRYQLIYHNASNQIQKIIFGSDIDKKEFIVNHDSQGNIIQALHKGIVTIEYHPVSQRTTRIQLVEGKSLRFYYDAQGERIIKRVFNPDGRITDETYYLRDEKGRVLMDYKIIHSSSGSKKKLLTAYIYGPRGLIGFIRNNNFYSVTTDHQGSVRLVIKNGRVVAAYDYMPYGELMRSFGDDPESDITYRYTGHEWDEETGLYNYHARLYDPSIGRFYQPDPQSQYFSPYKYAGNSPVSIVDPDGEFAFLIGCIIFAISGAYLGAAAANNSWNPARWDWKSSKTWLGLIGGGIGGLMLPIGFNLSFTNVALGFGVAYLSGAATNGWDLTKWNWSSPGTWNSLFQGFSTGTNIFTGLKQVHMFAGNTFGATGSRIFLGVSYTTAAGVAYTHAAVMQGNAKFWEWDWTDPLVYFAVVEGFDTGSGFSIDFAEIIKGSANLFKNVKKVTKIFKKTSWNSLKKILKNQKNPLYRSAEVLIMSYYSGSAANDDLDITRWNLAQFFTYEGILNGIFLGRNAQEMLRSLRQSKIKKLPDSSPKINSNFKEIVTDLVALIKLQKNINTSRRKTEFDRITQNIFSLDIATVMKNFQGLKNDAPKRFFKDLAFFLNQGLEKWKSGKSKPPERLHDFIVKQSNEITKKPSKKLIEWDLETQNNIRKHQEIFPDEDVDFLGCFGRRKKRQTGGFSCLVPSHSRDVDQLDEPDIVVKLLNIDGEDYPRGKLQADGCFLIERRTTENNKGYDQKDPKGFSENLSLMIDSIPKFHSTTKAEFFTNMILGAIASLPNSKTLDFTKDIFVRSKILEVNGIKHNLLQTYFTSEKDGKLSVVVKTFIAAPTKSDVVIRRELIELSRTPQEELIEASKKLGIDAINLPQLDETIFYIGSKYQLINKKFDEPAADLIPSTKKSDFVEIKQIADINFETHFEKIGSKNIDEARNGIENLFKDLLETYNAHKSLNLGSENEAGFHGFVYGVISLNLKKRMGIDSHVERVAGRGYADLMFITRKDKSDWDRTPVIVEFKADNSPAQSAISQIKNTGYLYNLGLRTLSNRALIVGVNSKTKDLKIEIANIPQYKGFVDQLLSSPRNKNNLEIQLKHLYYSSSPSTIKATSGHNYHYLSRQVAGEFLMKDNIDFHVIGNKEHADKLTTFLVKKKDSEEWTMLHFVESSTNDDAKTDYDPRSAKLDKGYKFKAITVSNSKFFVPVDPNKLMQVTVNVNSQSLHGWSSKEPRETGSKVKKDSYYFQEIKIEDNKNLERVSSESFAAIPPQNLENFFSNKAIDLPKEIGNMINTESDFQAILQGMFTGNPRKPNEVIRVFPESNPNKSGRIDLMVSIIEKQENRVQEKKLYVIELKYSSLGGADATNKMNEAKEQVSKYVSNLQDVTDLDEVTMVAAVYNKKTNSIETNFKDLDIYADLTPLVNTKRPPNLFESDRDKKREKTGERKKRFIEENLENCSYVRNFNNSVQFDKAATSGGERIGFWPITVGKTLYSTSISFIQSLLTTFSILSLYTVPQKQKPFFKKLPKSVPYTNTHSDTAPLNLLQMGDYWIQNTDINGLLMWSIILVNKVTRNTPKRTANATLDSWQNNERNHQATLINTLKDQTQMEELNIFKDTSCYYKIINDQINKNDYVNYIKELLCKNFVLGKINEFATKPSDYAYEFLTSIRESLRNSVLESPDSTAKFVPLNQTLSHSEME